MVLGCISTTKTPLEPQYTTKLITFTYNNTWSLAQEKEGVILRPIDNRQATIIITEVNNIPGYMTSESYAQQASDKLQQKEITLTDYKKTKISGQPTIELTGKTQDNTIIKQTITIKGQSGVIITLTTKDQNILNDYEKLLKSIKIN